MNRTTLQWISNTPLSFAQSLYVIASGEPSIDPGIAGLLESAVQKVNQRLLTEAVDVAGFWSAFREEMVRENSAKVATCNALKTAGCSEMLVDTFGRPVIGMIGDAETDFSANLPRLDEQIDLRCRPLRDRWDTCGFGLLRIFEKRFWGAGMPPQDWWVERLPVVMIQPCRGGDGGMDTIYPKVWMEAMLTDVDPEVPEVLRLAWWICRLAVDRTLSKVTSDPSLHYAYRLSTLPLLLESAREVDLVRSSQIPIKQAMTLWRVGEQGDDDVLSRWWNEEGQEESPWPKKVKALQFNLASEK